LWSEAPGNAVEAWTGDAARVDAAQAPPAMYFVVVAARDDAALPAADAAVSLFSDRAEGELARIDAMSGEVLRQDRLLHERDAALDRQTEHVRHLEDIATERDAALTRQGEHVRHLEEIAAYRERIVVERDAQLGESNALRETLSDERDGLARALGSSRQAVASLTSECERLERAIAAQERIIAYRQSARWWFALPWLRLRLWWQRVRGA
jgi:hypothetical protein